MLVIKNPDKTKNRSTPKPPTGAKLNFVKPKPTSSEARCEQITIKIAVPLKPSSDGIWVSEALRGELIFNFTFFEVTAIVETLVPIAGASSQTQLN